jgi:3-oxoadipate enol-lactonase
MQHSKTHWAEANGLSLHYAVSGRGARTLVLIHELAGTLESWDHVVPYLEDDFRILRVDQRGAGLSEKVRTRFDVTDLAADTEAILRAAGLAPPYFIAGVASGAAVAVALADRQPNDVAALALLAPSLSVNPDRRKYLLDRSDKAMREGMRSIIDVVFEKTYPRDAVPDAEIYAEHRARFLAIDPVCYALANRMLTEVGLDDAIAKLTCPCLLIAGVHDEMRPPAYVETLASQFRDAQIATIDSGHIMVVQAPQDVAAKMKAFFLPA